ncbi:Peptidyl-prolyl cis-trans isomerase CWC27 like protein [Eufriesea mexicana]|nr:Peptidyl-prolyl cis-trans isomerase CWC27 like protein [Eufriesea mexicana]
MFRKSSKRLVPTLTLATATLVTHRFQGGQRAGTHLGQSEGLSALVVLGTSACMTGHEFRTRFRSCGRDLIAIANAGKDDNGSQFFFTLGSTSELQNKRTIFCKVTGETIYGMLKFEEAPMDENDRPLYPPNMINTEILNNPFSDIIPRIKVQKSEEVKDSSKSKTAAVTNFNLLSFDEEAEEDEEESAILNKKFNGKSKSAHDHLTDPKLSLQPAVESPGLPNKKRKEDRISDWKSDDEVKT